MELEATVVFEAAQLARLFAVLKAEGWTTVGPTPRDGSVVLDELASPAELPVGWRDEQEKGRYRLLPSPLPTYFGCAVGAQAWKHFLYPSRQLLWRSERQGKALRFETAPAESTRYAFIGVRGCDLRAIEIQAAVRIGHGVAPPPQPFIVGVDCARSVATCFCASMGTGPAARGTDVDLRLAELCEHSDAHVFVASAGTARGAAVLAQLETRPAGAELLARAASQVAQVAASLQRSLDPTGLPELLASRVEDAQWDEIAERCLSCANCTMACPTCFCTTVEDKTDLTGDHAERWLRWDSCHNLDFSYVHGGSVRQSRKSRYRQWLTHKIGTWVAQFGSSGCVGCGRCIAWCPTGIDLTEEVAKFREVRDGDAPRRS
jgi:ferredoxin